MQTYNGFLWMYCLIVSVEPAHNPIPVDDFVEVGPFNNAHESWDFDGTEEECTAAVEALPVNREYDGTETTSCLEYKIYPESNYIAPYNVNAVSCSTNNGDIAVEKTGENSYDVYYKTPSQATHADEDEDEEEEEEEEQDEDNSSDESDNSGDDDGNGDGNADNANANNNDVWHVTVQWWW